MKIKGPDIAGRNRLKDGFEFTTWGLTYSKNVF